jgi:hypothetical protein
VKSPSPLTFEERIDAVLFPQATAFGAHSHRGQPPRERIAKKTENRDIL